MVGISEISQHLEQGDFLLADMLGDLETSNGDEPEECATGRLGRRCRRLASFKRSLSASRVAMIGLPGA